MFDPKSKEKSTIPYLYLLLKNAKVRNVLGDIKLVARLSLMLSFPSKC